MGPSLEGSDRETPRRQLSSRFLAGMDHSQGRGAGVQQGIDRGWSLWGNDPMQPGTPHATSGGRRLYTQDSFKEEGGGALFLMAPQPGIVSCKLGRRVCPGGSCIAKQWRSFKDDKVQKKHGLPIWRFLALLRWVGVWELIYGRRGRSSHTTSTCQMAVGGIADTELADM